MRGVTRIVGLLVLPASIALGGGDPGRARADDEAPQAPARPVTFALWYAPGAPEDAEVLTEVLRRGGAGTVERVQDRAAWMRAQADVLVLRGRNATGIEWSPDPERAVPDVGPLQGRRVLGIGYEGKTWFDALGLQTGATATFERPQAHLVLATGALLGEERNGEELTALDARRLERGPKEWASEGVHLPHWSHLLERVEVLARRGDRPEYAPVVREQNYLWTGISAHAGTWTEEYRALLGELAHRLGRRAVEPFSLPRWPVTASGTHELRLAGRDEPGCSHTMYFRFEEPVLLSVRLELAHGRKVMLHLRAEASRRDGALETSEAGEPLDLWMPITVASVEANQGRHWVLAVKNKGRTEAKGRLVIEYARERVLELPGGLTFAFHAPPSGADAIARLIGLLGHEDPVVRAQAGAALLTVGEPALAPLRAARDAALARKAEEARDGSPAPAPGADHEDPSLRLFGLIRQIEEGLARPRAR